MAIFRGVGGSGSSSDNSFLQEVTAQATTATNKANEASASATSAEASATSAANSLATIQNTEVTSAAFNTGDGVLTLTKLGGATVTADLDGRFLTSYTETNDLSTAVTWANVPNAYITAGSVTQHQAALTITESQISDLQSYLTSYTETNNLTTAVTWANVPDNFITQSSVTQHQAALSVTESQISDLQSYLTAETSHADVLVDGDFTSNGLMKRDGVGAYSVDSSTYATETYVDTAVSGLVDSAPATLDTLNELASALGDDANFSTTVTNSLAGKANLSGATFTGNVNVQDGLLSANSGANQPFFKVSTVAASGSAGVFVDGDIVVNGTVDGRDVATDGTKLDTLERVYRRRFAKNAYSFAVALQYLTTTYTGISNVIRGHTTTGSENELDFQITASHYDINSANEFLFYVRVQAPYSGAEDTVNLGTVSGVSYSGSLIAINVDGDVTKHLSPYCGMSTTSTGANAFSFNNNHAWFYDQITDKTVITTYAYQSNLPSNGDTLYLHPFDWESTGTYIIGDFYPADAYNASGTVNIRRDYKIYLGYFKNRPVLEVYAKESSSSENIGINSIGGVLTQYQD